MKRVLKNNAKAKLFEVDASGKVTVVHFNDLPPRLQMHLGGIELT